MTFRLTRGRVNVQATERAAPVLEPFWTFVLEVLVTKDDQSTLGDEKGQLRLGTIVEL